MSVFAGEWKYGAAMVNLPDFWLRAECGNPSQCWPWRGYRTPKGYGEFCTNNRQRVKAHRLALELRLGRSLRTDECACHTCDNPPCCNPWHLWPGSEFENKLDCIRKGRGEDYLLKVSADDPLYAAALRIAAAEFCPPIP